MIFMQDVCKEEKKKIGLMLAVLVFVPLAIEVILLIQGNDMLQGMIVILVLYIPLGMICLALLLDTQERFYIYEDRIEVKSILRRKNVVYYREVEYIEETEILMTTRGMPKKFYVFHDGRRNNEDLLDSNSCYNKKKYNLRIYKTQELEDYITKILCIEVRKQLP